MTRSTPEASPSTTSTPETAPSTTSDPAPIPELDDVAGLRFGWVIARTGDRPVVLEGRYELTLGEDGKPLAAIGISGTGETIYVPGDQIIRMGTGREWSE